MKSKYTSLVEYASSLIEKYIPPCKGRDYFNLDPNYRSIKQEFGLRPESCYCMPYLTEKDAFKVVDSLLSFFVDKYSHKNVSERFHYVTYEDLKTDEKTYNPNEWGIHEIGYYMGIPFLKFCGYSYFCKFLDDKLNEARTVPRKLSIQYGKFWKDTYQIDLKYAEELEKYIQKLTSIYKEASQSFEQLLNEKMVTFQSLYDEYVSNYKGIEGFMSFVLNESLYPFEFNPNPVLSYSNEGRMLIVDYTLPKIDEIPNKTWKKNASIVHKTDDDLVELPTTKLKALYEDVLYRITLRTIAEIYAADEKNYIDGICFNGIIHERNKATGQMEDNYILSLSVSKEQFLQIDLTYIDAKQCFKFLKGVGGSKLSNLSPIVPIVQIEKEDNRIIESRVISTTEDINLAEMDWEDFEHLVRQIFEWEFQGNGSEVKITQSSRDGGVDAIVYDPDPIRGGKIIIQAKRYTNTVGVSAVRDLYGTIINEGANKGILITTADYGSDSYKFAQDKPITLLNGGHLLYLMKKHGHSARIDLEEAKGHRQ